MESVLKKIEVLREDRNISIDTISNHLDISSSYYKKIIQGKTNLKFSVLSQIAQFLEIDITDLLD